MINTTRVFVITCLTYFAVIPSILYLLNIIFLPTVITQNRIMINNLRVNFWSFQIERLEQTCVDYLLNTMHSFICYANHKRRITGY